MESACLDPSKYLSDDNLNKLLMIKLYAMRLYEDVIVTKISICMYS